MARQHHNGPEDQAETPGDPAPQTRTPWPIRVWPYVRTGLVLVGLFTHDEGLHLAVQALVAVTDLAVKMRKLRKTR